MKKLFALLGVAALVSVTPTTPVFAESDNAAWVEKEGLCGGFIPTAEGGIGDFLLGDLHSVVTNKGNTSLICKFEFEEGLIPKARRASGFLCGTFIGLTTDSKMVATPDGDATLTCKINGSTA